VFLSPGWYPYGWYPYGWYPYGWGPRWDSYEREVALLIRDRKTGTLLYEARANNSGPSAAIDYLLPAMFEAALKDFRPAARTRAASPRRDQAGVELTIATRTRRLSR
jgi:hypothetical protein